MPTSPAENRSAQAHVHQLASAFHHTATDSLTQDSGIAFYRRVAECLPGGVVFVVDPDLRYQLAAGASLDAAGFTPSDFEGRLLKDAVPEEDYPHYERDYLTILQGGEFTREHEVNGLSFVTHGVPLTDKAGEILGALVVSYDISDRKSEERRLLLFKALGVAIREAATAADIETSTIRLLRQYFGDVECALLEVDEDRLQNIPPWLDEDCLEQLLAEPAPQAVYPAAGRAVLGCSFTSDGRVVGITAVCSDVPRPWSTADREFLREVSERAWVHMERLRLVAALREADRQKDRFLAVLAHELRNPLAVVRNGLDLLKIAGPAVPQDRVVQLMEQQFTHMGRLIEDVLDVSYICHGRMSLHLERVSLWQVVESAVEAARPAASAKHQLLSCSEDCDELAVEADPDRLTQAIANIITNAIKYSPARTDIRVDVRREGDRALVAVSDDGIGMSVETRQRLFDLFARGDDAELARAGAGGLGVGMWVTRQLVEAHGGTIHASSQGVGQGSTFTIALPLP
ncbi:ATP-binding protein [Massilia sp. 9I]|uniref:sensor histidine kinase n=1 Tax=Massilia sp. 9I TaxID=2653152 RepID=UPI0012F229A0|nr:ATP-binding protein [Massilia sp. 9I]VXB73330.1 putative Histidine kinase [Massilia sp. 9I]